MKRSALIAVAIVVVFIVIVAIYSLFKAPTEDVSEVPPPDATEEAAP